MERMVDLLGDHDIVVMEIDGFTHRFSGLWRDTLPHIESLLAQREKLRPAFLST